MDRSWMSKPKWDSAYKDGVDQFLSFAFRNLLQDSEILCPCKNCKNRINQSHDKVRTHLRCDGILQGYTTWVHHGEDYDSPSFAFADVQNNTKILPTSGVPRTAEVQDGWHGRLDDMQGLLQAAFVMPKSYESLSSMSDGEPDGVQSEFANMEHNVPEDGNPRDDYDVRRREHCMYASFLKDAGTKLYPGCGKFSKLSFLVTLYHLKCLHGWTQESFTSLLGVLSDALPHEANLPKNYYEAKNIIRGLGLDYVKIHACPNDCILFRGDTANQGSCHVCDSSRWKDDEKNDSATESKRKKKPAKVLRYFPLIPRLQRLFATEKTSEEMRWHDEGRIKDGKLRHPADGEAWKDFDIRYPEFSAEARNVRLGLASDGFNPFRNLSSKHSTWPVMLIPYNLPPWICMKQTSLILSMIIPGPGSPGNDIDVYLQPLIDELLELWGGVETFDASSEKKFSLRATLLWTLNDFPALAYLYGWSTGGKYTCPSCGVSTKSFYLKKGKKMCYMGHRRWLPQNHICRRRKREFDGTEETELAPKTMSGTFVLRMLQGKVFDGTKGMTKIKAETTRSKMETIRNASVKESIVITLCNMERIFLPSFFTVMVHLMVHLVEEVKLGGPVQYRWMYPLERFFVRLKALVKNRAHPEGSIAEGYRAEECMTFCSRFLEGATRFTRPSRNPAPSYKIKDMYLFDSAGEPIGKAATVRQFDNQLLVQGHRYVLRHCDELEDFRKQFVDEKSKQCPSTSLSPSTQEKLINEHFPDWLEQKVLLDDGPGIAEKIRALAAKPSRCVVRYNGYIINGFRFHTMSREAACLTQNSGVVNIAEDGVNYYGRLSDIIELSYRYYKVVLFKCDWYDVYHRAGLQKDEFGFTLVNFSRKIHTGEKLQHDPFVFSSQVQQIFYVQDPKAEGWNVVVRVSPRDLFDMGDELSLDEAD